MTTDEIMRLAEALADTTSECDRAGAAVECICLPANTALRSAVDTLVAERDALKSALTDTLDFCERHSNRWDGINGKHPFTVVEAARAALKGKT